MLQAHAASIQDRDGALPLLEASRRGFPFTKCAFADSADAADRVAHATRIAIEIVRKHPDQIGFAVHPRRWVVERFFEAFRYAASVMLLTRRLARSSS